MKEYIRVVYTFCTFMYMKVLFSKFVIYFIIKRYTVRKALKCSGDSEILHEIVRHTTRISSCLYVFCVV